MVCGEQTQQVGSSSKQELSTGSGKLGISSWAASRTQTALNVFYIQFCLELVPSEIFRNVPEM